MNVKYYCSRCGAIYETTFGISFPLLCTRQTSLRSSGICGGEIISFPINEPTPFRKRVEDILDTCSVPLIDNGECTIVIKAQDFNKVIDAIINLANNQL